MLNDSGRDYEDVNSGAELVPGGSLFRAIDELLGGRAGKASVMNEPRKRSIEWLQADAFGFGGDNASPIASAEPCKLVEQ